MLNQPPEEYDIQQRLNRPVLEGEDLLQEKINALKNPTPRAHPNEIPFFANTNVPAQPSPFGQPAGGVGNDLFCSQAATAIRSEKAKTQAAIDDALYEFPDNMPELELGDSLIETLGKNVEDLFNVENLTRQEEEDEVLKKIKEEYGFEDIKDTMDEERNVPESIYFFYGGERENFVRALEFIGLSLMNRELAAFLLSELGQQVMTENKLSVHVESGDIFYENHNTVEKFYNFLLAQQNEDAAFIPKKFSYRRSFESYITNFL